MIASKLALIAAFALCLGTSRRCGYGQEAACAAGEDDWPADISGHGAVSCRTQRQGREPR